jgi:hypothetical protein
LGLSRYCPHPRPAAGPSLPRSAERSPGPQHRPGGHRRAHS